MGIGVSLGQRMQILRRLETLQRVPKNAYKGLWRASSLPFVELQLSIVESTSVLAGISGHTPARRIGLVAHFGEQLLMPLLESVGDVFQKDQAEHDVLVLSRIHVVAELVGGQPELGFNA